ncbi:MAG: hypothetical protein ACLFVE_03710 [Chitinispirillaceae bacterium]
MNDGNQIIPGIYNYCDRWCERCMMTSHCGVFIAEKQEPELPGSDSSNEEFWDKLEDEFSDTHDFLLDQDQEESIDLSDELFEEYQRREEEIRKRVEDNVCVKMAMKYLKIARVKLDASENPSETTETEHNPRINSGVMESVKKSENTVLDAAFDVISWYVFFIYTKLSRALHTEDDDFFDDGIQNDSNGSAKIALIAIDRSIAAWGVVMNAAERKSDDIMDILVLLGRLRKAVITEFPFAQAFVRPGFDEV